MRDFELPGRSPVHSTEAMVATSNPLASSTAIDILRRGGNAIDAAVAAAAVLAVVEPYQTGIGGDCFVLLAPKGGADLIAFNGSGRAPGKAEIDWYFENNFREVPIASAHAVTIPGAVDAWAQLVRDHGRMSLGELLQPAIRYAEEGYPVHSRAAFDWTGCEGLLKQDTIATGIFLPNGKAPKTGERFRQPQLAHTLRLIATQGREGFYQGPVAEDIVNHLRSRGGHHTLADFAEARGNYVQPISTSYRGVDVYQLPPNNQGITALIMLNILSTYSFVDMDPVGAQRLHLEIEAGRLAYRDRDVYIGDSVAADVIDQLLSQEHAAELASEIDQSRAGSPSTVDSGHGSDTVYLCVVDQERNAVSLINSIFHSFGSGLVSPNTGVVLQNRGAGFRIEPGHPNCIAPGKRPLHTIMPGMALKDGRVVMPFGVMGGHYQPFGNAHVLSNILDFGCDLQQALDMPRVFYEAGCVQVERGISESTRDGLVALGYRLARPDEPLGGGQAIWIDWESGVLTGGSDSRMDGCALGY
ncbi:MAG: gamma-glutamyltransferase [Gammaproteobacteria bacterium]|nr:gamma-glutamyltransferase [Gammaproteobacteria bacterium]